MRLSKSFDSPISTQNDDGPLSSNLLSCLSAAAAEEEAGIRHIGRSIDLLRAANMLADDGTHEPGATARALMQVGAANLSVGRLWEGHINALLLINLYGTSHIKRTSRDQISDGAFFGVWGADGKVPVTLAASAEQLMGSKNFASGLGTVSHAIVTVNSGPHVRLALIDVTNTKRADPTTWDMQGMKATASGRYDFTDLPVGAFDWIGEPGDYLREPHFVGGVWRIAALQIGAVAGLLDCAAAELRKTGRMQAEQQRARLMSVLMQAWAGMALVERAAMASTNSDIAEDLVVSTSIAARLFTEQVGLASISAVEQSLGLQHFTATSQTGRMARDLSVYLRQAARDAFLQRAAEFALVQEDNVWGVFE